MAKTYATLQTSEPQPHTLLITLNRPEIANAMNTQMGLDLLDLFRLQSAARQTSSAASCSPAPARARSAPGAI